MVASIARGLYFWVIKGIMANVLISRPIHARSQWELVTVIKVPIVSENTIIIKI